MRFSLHGCYQYDPTLFDDIELPEAVDKEVLVNVIMKSSGELFPYHQVPAQLKLNITFWFRRMKYNFGRLAEAMTIEYSPVENYDRYEDSESNIKPLSTRHSQTVTTPDVSTTITGKKSSFDSSAFQNHDQSVTSQEGSDTVTSKSWGEGEDTTNFSTHVHGNIGVTTAMQTIKEEYALRLNYDFYCDIAKRFEKEFLIQVY